MDTSQYLPQVRELVLQGRGRDYIASALGIGTRQARTLISIVKQEIVTAVQPPASRQTIDWSQYPELDAGVLVLSDLHIPYHDVDWIAKCVDVARTMGIKRLIIAGDLLDSKQLGKFADQSEHTLEDEVDQAHQLVAWLRSRFEQIDVFPGNHDARFARAVGNQISTTKLLEWACGNAATIHSHHHVYVGQTWLVAHPGAYSRVPGRPAEQLAAKFQRSVATAHTHKWALSFDVSGNHWIAEIGACANPRYFGYTHRELRTFPAHQQGALIIDSDERPHLLHPRLL